jgi:hypothetical protein
MAGRPFDLIIHSGAGQNSGKTIFWIPVFTGTTDGEKTVFTNTI